MIRILTAGGFQNRSPLAYAPILEALGPEIELVAEPQDADLLVISHPMDLDLFGSRLRQMLVAHPRLRLVLLSEEPFWDTGWGSDPFGRDQVFATLEGPVSLRVLNHQNSAIYRADRIPYFLLTDPRYIGHWRPLFDRNAGLRVAEWLAHFRGAEWDAAFMGERRLHDRDRVAFPAADVWGLSHYRTRFAERSQRGRVLRAGRGWPMADGRLPPPRQDLPDWHADKLARLDLHCRYLGAFENTHQTDYVSEKIFDAFALGAVPLYFAAPDHAVHRLIGAGGWLNFHATPPRAPAFDARRPVTLAEAESYAATQGRLAALFADPAAVPNELTRLARALLLELRAALLH